MTERSYTAEEAATIAAYQWSNKGLQLLEESQQTGIPSIYLSRASEDAALSAFGDAIAFGGDGSAADLNSAERLFRDSLGMYLWHMGAGSDASKFYEDLAVQLEASGIGPGLGSKLGNLPPVRGEDFWSRLEERVKGARDVFVTKGPQDALTDMRRQNAALIASSIVAAGELVGRGDVDEKAVLPVRMLDRSTSVREMKTSSAAARVSTTYQSALESLKQWEREAKEVSRRVGVSSTTLAIAPVLVAARGPLSVGRLAEDSGKSRNTTDTFLQRVEALGLVKRLEQKEGRVYSYLGSGVGAGASNGKESVEKPAAALPDTKGEGRSRLKGR